MCFSPPTRPDKRQHPKRGARGVFSPHKLAHRAYNWARKYRKFIGKKRRKKRVNETFKGAPAGAMLREC